MKVFLTGASGYIGGTVANALLKGGHEVIGLARSPKRALQLKDRGIEPLLGDLDDAPLLGRAARESDAAIHAAGPDHRPAVEAILAGLRGSGKAFVHTSGAGIVADQAGGEATPAVYEDDTPFPVLPPRAARAELIALVRQASADGVRTVVIAPAMVYGRGAGINPQSIQIPRMIALAKKAGVAKYVGRGENAWASVHVGDLAELYRLALHEAPAGAFYYAESCENTMRDIARAISRMLGFGERTESLSLSEAYAEYGVLAAALSFGSNCRVRAVRARRELGWLGERPSLLEEIEYGSYAADRAHLTV